MLEYLISMEILREITERRAYRAFSGDSVGTDVIDRIVGAAHLAASCLNNQPWHFVIYETAEEIERISTALTRGNQWASKSAFLAAVVTDPEDDCRLSHNRDYALFDTGMAVENMMLQAVHEGLYAHPMAGFDPDAVREISQVPENFTIVAMVAFGVPGDPADLDERLQKKEGAPRVRKPVEEVIHRKGW